MWRYTVLVAERDGQGAFIVYRTRVQGFHAILLRHHRRWQMRRNSVHQRLISRKDDEQSSKQEQEQ
jgi:hypothetical protein